MTEFSETGDGQRRQDNRGEAHKVRRLACGLAACAVLSTAALAQTPKKSAPAAPPAPAAAPSEVPVPADPQATSATFGDWILTCQKIDGAPDKLCEIAQSVQVQGQPGPITRLAVAREKDARIRLTLVLPTNVTLEKRPAVSADEKDTGGLEVGWTRCLPGGCFATTLMMDDLVKTWRASTTRGRVAFQDGLGRDIALPFSLRGFAQAMDALAKQ